MKVIILSVSKYKEKDCIFNAISKDGFISFQAKGAQDPKGKFIWLNNPLTIADVEFMEDGRYKHSLLKNAMPVAFALNNDYTLEYLAAVNALIEISNNVLQDEEKHLAFNDLLAAIKALKNGKDCYMVVLIYLSRLLKFSGVEFEVDHCVFCGGTTSIATFSFENGGFVCTNCMRDGIVRDLAKSQMKLIRYIFKSPDYSCLKIENYSLEDKKLILKKLKEFVDNTIGVNLRTFDLLLK